MGVILAFVLLSYLFIPIFFFEPSISTTYWNENNTLYIFALVWMILFVSALFPRVLFPIYLLWMKFAKILGLVFSPVILFLMFFLIFSPMALFLRLVKKDLLKVGRRWENCPSMWQKKPKDLPFDMTKQF